jgi:uncharacterized protein (TIGR02444 family)
LALRCCLLNTSAHDSPFWRFSLRFYALPGVASACLVLQDEAGADINLLLLLLFLAQSRHEVAREDVARLDATVCQWRDEAVKPLRTIRRRLKAGTGDIPAAASEAFRNQVKRIELEAERVEQHILEREAAEMTFKTAASTAAAAEANLAAYGTYLGGLPAEVRKIVFEAFTNAPP